MMKSRKRKVVWSFVIVLAVAYALFFKHTLIKQEQARRNKGRQFADVALQHHMTFGEVKRLLQQDPKINISAKANLRGATFWYGLISMYFYAPPGGVDDTSVAAGWEISDDFRGLFDGIRPGETIVGKGINILKVAPYFTRTDDGRYTRKFGNWRITCRSDNKGKVRDLQAWDKRLKWIFHY
jgi:hypothetical protein